ncbi:hypothetical protein VTN02DRAFT_862 [Thermoascus thermophilus]
MSSLFAKRRKPLKIGQAEDEDENGSEQDNEPVVKRPPSSKPKQKSKLRLSFGPGETSMAEDGDEDSPVVMPKRPGLGRRVLEKSAFQRSLTPSRMSEHLPIRVGQDQDRPSYSEDYLKELRDSTPSTPKYTSSEQAQDKEGEQNAVDVAAKFGEVMEMPSGQIVIPSEAEIREKKARRARLAKEQRQEQDFISLDDDAGDDEDDDEWSLATRKEKPETRLVRDDEDFAEGFDEYVEDGRVALGRKAEREQERRQREEMRDLIEEAENTSDEDDSDAERRAAYEAAQTRAAMGLEHTDPSRPKTPPKITSLPRLASSLERLRTTLAMMEQSKAQLVNRMEDLRKEKAEIAVREVRIQTLIKEAGENYERLRAEAGLAPNAEAGLPGDEVKNHRGLESIGTTSMTVSNAASEDESSS